MKQLASLALPLALPLALGACFLPEQGERGGVEQIEQDSGVTSSLRGLAVVDADIAWIGAPDGQILRTVDGGDNWTIHPVEGAGNLDFRSAHAFSADRALFIGADQPARIYETRDGGGSFDIIWEDASGSAFFDTLEFWDDQRGIAFSDPVDGEFLVLLSADGGNNWTPAEGLPAPLDGEAGFAASDTMIAVSDEGCAWIGTGGGDVARVLRSCDYGASWSAFDTPIAAGTPGSGIFSLAWTGSRLIAAGGNYEAADSAEANLAWSDDRGETWTVPEQRPGGYRSVVARFPTDDVTFIAAGSNGFDLSWDNGESWNRMSDVGYHAIGFAPGADAGWAVGSEGRVLRFIIHRRNTDSE